MNGRGKRATLPPTSHIIITTSRRPSPRTRSLVKDLVGIIPGALSLTRGHLTYQELSIEAATLGADRVVILGEKRGNPSIIRIYRPSPPNDLENIVTIIIKGVKLSREAGTPSKVEARSLTANPDDGEASMQIAEALVRGLHARLRADSSSVIANLRTVDDRESMLSFTYRNVQVGPVLRLGIPLRMIKDA